MDPGPRLRREASSEPGMTIWLGSPEEQNHAAFLNCAWLTFNQISLELTHCQVRKKFPVKQNFKQCSDKFFPPAPRKSRTP